MLHVFSVNVFIASLTQHYFSVVCNKMETFDRRCSLVVRVPSYISIGPGSIPGAIRFFFGSSGSGTGSTQPRE
jgi:hypothetical protein